MNYRHSYHAGGFSDVIKHLVLVAILKHLQQKSKPFLVMDVHAGPGIYHLQGLEAQKTLEFQKGIDRLFLSDDPLLEDFLAAVRSLNPDQNLTYYPGSPALIQAALREQDCFIANELHVKERAKLALYLGSDPRVTVTDKDALAAVKALLPHKIRRGLLMIDPSFEKPDEWEKLEKITAHAYQRWQTSTHLIWYPIKEFGPVDLLHEFLRVGPWDQALALDFLIHPANTPFRLNGCGFAVINPPFGLYDYLEKLEPVLTKHLTQTEPRPCRLKWLKREA